MIEGAERPELRTLDDRVVNVWRAGSLVRAAALSGLVLAVELLLGTPWPS
ncbi:MAG: hypothetical protein GWN71_11490, partial [Gammaproteobacteria bacterium]|nr:hypothetical protein [Gemmatimonadota bacterium]NIU74177.1 hypothetical protein [Gammaproteobacteria bacterium]